MLTAVGRTGQRISAGHPASSKHPQLAVRQTRGTSTSRDTTRERRCQARPRSQSRHFLEAAKVSGRNSKHQRLRPPALACTNSKHQIMLKERDAHNKSHSLTSRKVSSCLLQNQKQAAHPGSAPSLSTWGGTYHRARAPLLHRSTTHRWVPVFVTEVWRLSPYTDVSGTCRSSLPASLNPLTYIYDILIDFAGQYRKSLPSSTS